MVCKIPGCGASGTLKDGYCSTCIQSFSPRALELMVEMGLNPIKLLIFAASQFTRALQIADFLGISLPTLYTWLFRYFGLTFNDFKMKYICKEKKCIVVDFSASAYAWRYTMSDRIREEPGGCNCFLRGPNSDALMLTTLTPDDIRKVLCAEPSFDNKEGIYHLRYPLGVKRLPILGDDE